MRCPPVPTIYSDDALTRNNFKIHPKFTTRKLASIAIAGIEARIIFVIMMIEMNQAEQRNTRRVHRVYVDRTKSIHQIYNEIEHEAASPHSFYQITKLLYFFYALKRVID